MSNSAADLFESTVHLFTQTMTKDVLMTRSTEAEGKAYASIIVDDFK